MRRLVLPGLLVFSLVTLIVCPLVGPHTLSLDGLRGVGNDARIFWELRLPRVLLAWITGATLSLCGMVYQAIFRNPLASPDMLGVSTGAAFGAVLAIRLGVTFTLFGIIPGISAAAFIGAVAATAVISAVGTLRRGGMSEASLLLGGVAVSFLFGSLNMILQYGGGYVDTFRMMRWSMGGIQAVGFVPVLAAFPALAVIFVTALAFAPELDLFTCGENIAAARGVSVLRLRRLLFLAVSVSVGMNVALCGPIGFVG
ncbi:MAG TPA: iron ABC transporter permease, partial [Synergistaceae bacterium]|nr:iron ABC transporter permease [Synergistaceae bacterium]